MKCNGLRLDFTLLHINLISAENDGYLFTDSDEITCGPHYIITFLHFGGLTYDASLVHSCM